MRKRWVRWRMTWRFIRTFERERDTVVNTGLFSFLNDDPWKALHKSCFHNWKTKFMVHARNVLKTG